MEIIKSYFEIGLWVGFIFVVLLDFFRGFLRSYLKGFAAEALTFIFDHPEQLKVRVYVLYWVYILAIGSSCNYRNYIQFRAKKNNKMAKKMSNNKGGSLCSGYKVFPDGRSCKGCIDCDFLKSKKSVDQVFRENHTTARVGKNFNLVDFFSGPGKIRKSEFQPTLKRK